MESSPLWALGIGWVFIDCVYETNLMFSYHVLRLVLFMLVFSVCFLWLFVPLFLLDFSAPNIRRLIRDRQSYSMAGTLS